MEGGCGRVEWYGGVGRAVGGVFIAEVFNVFNVFVNLFESHRRSMFSMCFLCFQCFRIVNQP